MIKGKKALFSMIVSAAFMVSSMTTSVDAIKKDTVLKSTKLTTMEVFGTSNINIRTGSGNKYKKIGYAKKGQTVNVISISKGWAKISYKGSTAYVDAKYLKKVSSFKKIEMISKVKSLTVRTGPSSKYSIMGKLSKGNTVIAVDKLSNDWVKVEYKGKIGYIYNSKGKYLKEGALVEDRKKANDVIKLINNLPKNIKLNNKSAVNKARLSYNSLNKKSKALVTNLNKLVNAENKIKTLEKEAEENKKNKELASKVIVSINGINTNVSLLEKSKVVNARKMYSQLPGKAKVLVTNINKLVNAENTIAKLETYSINAKKVENKIKTLNKEILCKDEGLIKEIRKEFDALNKEEQKLVSNTNILTNAEKQMKQILNRLHNVINLINNIPEKVTLEDKAMIENTRLQYESLKADEKEKLKGISLSMLINAETEIGRLETIEKNTDVKNVVLLIEELPNIEEITYSHKDKVMSVLKAYRALPENLKFAVDITKLMDSVDKIEIIDANILVKEINNLPSIENISKNNKEEIESIRARYNAISIRNNKRVTNLNKLIEAEKELEKSINAVNAVESLIKSIPETSKITLSNKTLIEKIRAEYEALLSKDKNAVDSQCYKVLVEAEDTIKNLENSPEIKNVNEKIDTLMDKELTLDDKPLVKEIRMLYDDLHISLKDGVDVSMIEEFEIKINELETQIENAKKMEEKIAILDREIFYKDFSLIRQIRAEFNSLSKEEQKLVSNINILTDAEKQMNQILARVHNVTNLINDIPVKVTLEDKAMIENVRAAYEALKDDEKESLKGVTLSMLIGAEIEIHRLETIENNENVKYVVSLIESLPGANEITYDDKTEIMSVLNAYRALPEDVKFAVDITKLMDAVDKIEIMDAKIIVEEINNLPSVENITIDHKEKIESIRKRYNAISIRNNKRVTNLNILIAAEEKLKVLESNIDNL